MENGPAPAGSLNYVPEIDLGVVVSVDIDSLRSRHHPLLPRPQRLVHDVRMIGLWPMNRKDAPGNGRPEHDHNKPVSPMARRSCIMYQGRQVAPSTNTETAREPKPPRRFGLTSRPVTYQREF